MNGVVGEYTITEEPIYLPLANKLSYQVEYEPIALSGDDTFVYGDVEFYAVRLGEKVNALYFNEFNHRGTMHIGKIVRISDDKFNLQNKEYEIRRDGDTVRISVDSATTKFHDDEMEWKGEVQTDDRGNERISIDGLWYNLVKDDNGEYTELRYAGLDDNQLKKIDIVTEGENEGQGWYSLWNLHFQFSGDWTTVQVIKRHQTDVIDRLDEEWCEFDDVAGVKLDSNRTLAWHVASQLLSLMEGSPETEYAVKGLGGGVLYEGLLKTPCEIKLTHDVSDGIVTTRGLMTFPDGHT